MISGFHSPVSPEEAVKLRISLGEGAYFLGGGTELNSSTPPPGPIEHLINLGQLNLRSIEIDSEEILIGAGCTIQEIIEAEGLPKVLKQACLQVENRSIRNQATIGGHIAAAHPYASVLPLLVALDAKLDVFTSDASPRTDPIMEHVGGAKGALISRVRIPVFTGDARAAVGQYCRSAIDLSLLSVAVFCRVQDGSIINPRIIVGGLGRMPQRMLIVEKQLEGEALPQRETLEAMISENVKAESDSRAGAEFRRYMAGVLVARALLEVAS